MQPRNLAHNQQDTENLEKELEKINFNSMLQVIHLLKKHNATLDKAKDDPDANRRTQLILEAYIHNCSDPQKNILPLAMLLGEEDLNLPLLKFVEKSIRERETYERKTSPSFKLPSLKLTIKEAEALQASSSNPQQHRSPHVQLSLLTSSSITNRGTKRETPYPSEEEQNRSPPNPNKKGG